jgi:hypothetical protein
MQLRAFIREDETAGSAVSAFLFLGAAVVFAVAVGGLLIGTSQEATAEPDVTFGFNGDADRLEVLHAKGEDFEANRVSIEGSATAFEGGDSVRWANAPQGTSGTVTVGDAIVLGGEADQRYSLQRGRLEVVWHGKNVEQATIIGTHQVRPYESI